MRLSSYGKPALYLLTLLGIGVFLWYLVDPEAGQKIKTLADYIGGVLVIILFLWIALSSKQKRRTESDKYYDYNDNADRRNRRDDKDSEDFDRNDDNDFEDD
ncbi:hypothetical protein [Thiomicrorhabdus indica]|uniref:hypothetical protein n=1 Tax=Thiomicrorhabdus indica TaxID=2267253 RepID=UPI002AA8B0A5|nr:hypothetical protein [Thiomicrorhabdus indica]